MRLLVYAQDRITRLEEELDRIDQEESNPLFLGASRIDSNPNRLQALKNLEQALENYGSYENEKAFFNVILTSFLTDRLMPDRRLAGEE